MDAERPSLKTPGTAGYGFVAMVAMMIAYGSLLPFESDFSGIMTVGDWSTLDLTLHPPTLEDLITNLLLYMPLGFCFAIHQRRRPILGGLVLGLTLSFTLERAQIGDALRVPSWIDVALNTLGCAAGTFTVAPLALLVGKLRDGWNSKPFAILAAIVMISTVFCHVSSFEFVKSSEELNREYLETNWNVVFHGSELADEWAKAVQRAGYALLFLGMGYLTTLAGRESRSDISEIVLASFSKCLLMSAIVTTCLLLDKTSQMDLGVFIVAAFGAIVGIWLAGSENERSKKNPSLREDLSAPILLTTAAIAAVLIVFANIKPELPSHGLTFAAINWLPFHDLWRGRMIDAATTSVKIAGATLAFAAVIRLVISQWRVDSRQQNMIILLALVLSAVGLEWIRAGNENNAMDITSPIIVAATLIAARSTADLIRNPESAQPTA